AGQSPGEGFPGNLARGPLPARHEQPQRLLRLHLGRIDALDAAIAKLDREVEAAIAPFRTAVQQVTATPGIKSLAARTILSETGTDMRGFPTSGHLLHLPRATMKAQASADRPPFARASLGSRPPCCSAPGRRPQRKAPTLRSMPLDLRSQEHLTLSA